MIRSAIPIKELSNTYTRIILDSPCLSTTFSWNEDDEDFPSEWFPSKNVSMNSVFSLSLWKAMKQYIVRCSVNWNVRLPEPETTHCGGEKCRRKFDVSFDQWCLDCHLSPDRMKIDNVVRLYVTDSTCENAFTMRQIGKYIVNIDILSIEEIGVPNIMERIEEIVITTDGINTEIEKLKTMLDNLHTHFGFSTKEEMEDLTT